MEDFTASYHFLTYMPGTEVMTQYQRVDFANTLRGFAALSVLISHYYGAFWLNRPAVAYLTNAPALPLESHFSFTVIWPKSASCARKPA
jgi:hypothetical protein